MTFRTSAENYDRHIGRYGPALAPELIAAAGIAAGDRVLDVGCGPGALTAALVARLGADHVSAVDPSPPFAKACGERTGAHVQVAGAESLPFADATFDAALAQLVVNFMADAPAGAREMARVTRPGGTVAAAVWDYGGEMTILRRFWDAVAALDPDAGADESQMRYCTPPELEALWNDIGLAHVQVSTAVVSARYDGFEDLWAPLESGVAPSGAYTVSLSPDRRTALKQEFRARLGVGDEPFALTARAWIVTGRRA